MDGSLFLIDALNFLYRAFHAMPPLTTSKGAPTGAIYGLCQMLSRIEREQKPSHMCVVMDAPGKTFRDDLFPQYKAHRPPMPPELAAQVELVPEVIRAFGLPVLSVPGVEADDVVATVSRLAVAAGMRVVICSSDKDLMQLCSDQVSILDTMKNRTLGPAEVEEKWGVPPRLVGDVLALMGDSVDNVPGVAGIGPKTAAELIRTYGSLDALLARVGEVKGQKGQSIAQGRASVELSRRLVQLKDDVTLPVHLAGLARIEPDHRRLVHLFGELEFSRLLAQETGAVAGRDGAPPPAPAAVTPSVPVEIVVDHAALEALAGELRAAGGFGLAILGSHAEALRAEVIGIGLALPPGRRAYVPLGHRYLGAPAMLPLAQAMAVLGPVLADGHVAKHVYDGKFLTVLLAGQGADLAGVASDALLASYVLDASRAKHDLDILAAELPQGPGGVLARETWLGKGKGARAAGEVPASEAAAHVAAEAAASLALAGFLDAKLVEAKLADLYRALELPLSGVLARIESRGIRLDTHALRALGQEVGMAIAGLESEIHRLAGTTFNIASPKQLAEVLFGKLQLPVIRKTKTGASTDADVLEELAALHDVPAKIVEYRTLSKLKGTYIDSLPSLVNPKTGRLHTTFNQAVAATGRLSSSNPNLQNIPIRTDLGKRIRQAFIADAGNVLVSADYSQIELRVLAHVSEDPAFVDAFRSGQDVHQRTASEVFGVPLAQVSSEQRRIAKAINFGLVFGQTDFGLASALRIPRADARKYIASYFERYAGARTYMERTIALARETGVVSTLLGRRRPLPEIRSSRAQERSYGERMARNTPIQGSAADILKLAMIKVDEGIEDRFPGARLLLTVHDELVFEVKEADVAAFSVWVKAAMESVYELRVPLIVDVGHGRTWASAH